MMLLTIVIIEMMMLGTVIVIMELTIRSFTQASIGSRRRDGARLRQPQPDKSIVYKVDWYGMADTSQVRD